MRKKFVWWLLLIFATLFLTAIIPFLALSWSNESQAELAKSREYVGQLGDLLSMMKDAETGQRGFVITGRESFLGPYYSAVGQARMAKAQLQLRVNGDPVKEQKVSALFNAMDLKFNELAETIALRRSGGFAVVEPVISSERGKQYMDQVREMANQLSNQEYVHIGELSRVSELRSRIAAYLGVVAIIADVIMLSFVLNMMVRLLAERKAAMLALQKSQNELNSGFAELQKRNGEIMLMADMTRALESVSNVNETYDIIAIYCAKLLTSQGGALYLFRNSRDLLEKEAQWGSMADMPDVMEPHDCWALRQGNLHYSSGAEDLRCPHYHESGSERAHAYLCLPLVAQSEVLGLICLESASESEGEAHVLGDKEGSVARAVAEQIALGLSNARLRQVLQQQSIIDPLTGLFNRRYMDETLRREISRATRKAKPLSLILLDVDHFKKVNDTYGHEAGDMVLAAVSNRVKNGVRDCDLACRFGGEELVLILPECDKDAAVLRAERLREEIAALNVQHGASHVGHMTASFGVATYPLDATSPEALIQAADQAMYAAKNGGRNRVVAAG